MRLVKSSGYKGAVITSFRDGSHDPLLLIVTPYVISSHNALG